MENEVADERAEAMGNHSAAWKAENAVAQMAIETAV